MERIPLTEEEADVVYDLLVKECAAQGSGGKFYFGRYDWRVSYYKEDPKALGVDRREPFPFNARR